MKLANYLILGLLTGSLSCCQPAAGGAENGLVNFADSLFNTAVDSGQIAGAAVLVKKDGELLLQKSYGLASLELAVPMPESGTFEIGSVTKQFTAAAILKLASAGKISLDDDFTQYVPMDTGGRKISIRHLLNHTSGIPGYTEIPEFWKLSIESRPRDTLLRLVESKPFLFEPGERLIYNNTGYFILGLVIEKASGQPYADFLKEVLFEPLEMRETYYCSQSEVVPGKVYGYDFSESGLKQKPYADHTWPFAAGSLCSSAGDLLKWMEALHNGQILSPEEYREISQPKSLNDGSPLRYAMGLVNFSDYGHRLIGHDGGMYGFLSETRYYPDDDLYVICLVNTTGPRSAGYFAGALTWNILQKARLESSPFDQDAGKLSGTFTGQVRGSAIDMEIEVTPEGLIWKVVGEPTGDSLNTYMGDAVWTNGKDRFHYREGKWIVDQVSGYYVFGRKE